MYKYWWEPSLVGLEKCERKLNGKFENFVYSEDLDGH